MLYVFRHLQNSIFEHLKYTQCFIDLQKFKASLISHELEFLKPLKSLNKTFQKSTFENRKKEQQESSSIISLNSKLIHGKTPTCILSICKWASLSNSIEKPISALQRLRLYGKNLVYRLLCNEKLENPLVFTIIRNLGMHVNRELRQIAFATIRRDVRETLLTHLEHVGRISEQERLDIVFLRKLETFLPNQAYSTAKERSWFQALRKPLYKPIDKTKALQLQVSFFALPASMKLLTKDSENVILVDLKSLKSRTKPTYDLLKNLKAGVLNELMKELKPKSFFDHDYKTIGCDLDDFKETSVFFKSEFFSGMEEFHEALFQRRFTVLNDFNLPFVGKPQSEDSSGFFSSEITNTSHCLKCKTLKTTGNDLLIRENDGYFQGCLDWTRDWDCKIKQKILLELKDINWNSEGEEIDLMVLLDFYLQNHDWLSLKILLEKTDARRNMEILDFFERNLNKTTVFLRETIKDFFVETHDLYFKDEESNVRKKLQRLAKIGNLFPSTCFISMFPKPNFIEIKPFPQEFTWLKSFPNETINSRPSIGKTPKIPNIFPNFTKKSRLTSELHLEILDFFVFQGYLLILDEYLRFHGLDSSIFSQVKKSPASYLMFLSRNPIEKLFELGMRNAEWLTGSKSLNEILQEKRVFRVLGILMYAKIESFEKAYQSKGKSCFIDKDLFEESIGEFPDLKAVVFEKEYDESEMLVMLEKGELESMERDMSLRQLIDQNPYFNYMELIKDIENEKKNKTSIEKDEFSKKNLEKKESSTENKENNEGLRKNLKIHEVFTEDFMYFLYISRPFESFTSLFLGISSKDWSKHLKNLTNDKEKANDLYRKAFTIALNKPFSRNCTAACVVFLELLGFDSRLFKVDLEVSRRILLHLSFKNSEKIPSNSELFNVLFSNTAKPIIKKSILQPIIELFLNVPFQTLENMASDSPIHSSELLNLLRLLEDATREMESLQYFHKEKTKIHSPWQLVSSFCQFHNLPRSLTLLHELARNNEWIMLLYEAYSQKCPIDTLQDIIEKYLYEGPLQKHLLNMISSLNNKPNVLYWEPETLSTSSINSLFEELLRHHDRSYKSIVLRLHALVNHLIISQKAIGSELHQYIISLALELKKPFFVILAYAISNHNEKSQGFAILLNIMGFQMLNNEKNERLKEQLRNSLKLTAFIKDDEIAKLIIVLCLMRKTKEIITILKLFFPQSRILKFLRFWHQLCKRDFQQAFKKMREFLTFPLEKTDFPSNSPQEKPLMRFSLDFPPFLNDIVFTLLSRICEEDFLTEYEMTKLLEILYYLDFNPMFSNYYITEIFLQKIRPFSFEIVESHNLKYSSNPLKIYQCLIEINLIEEAKAYANYFDISEDYANIGEIVSKWLQILKLGLLEGLDHEVCLIFQMIIEKFPGNSCELAFQWIYQLNQSPWFSLKQQAFALYFSGCLSRKINKFMKKLVKIKFELFCVLYSCGFEAFKTDKRKGFLDFEFELTKLPDFKRLINELSIENRTKRILFKTLTQEIASETCDFALNRLDIDFIQYFIGFKANQQLISSLKSIEVYKLMDEILKNEEFWELDYENLLFLLQNPHVNLNMYDERLKGIISTTYLPKYKPFIKSIFLLTQLSKKINQKPVFSSVKDLITSIKTQPLERLFNTLLDQNQNLLIKRYFKLIDLDPIVQISIMLNYFIEKATRNNRNFWTFQQFIEFVEMTPQPALLAKILINYTANNVFEPQEKLQLFACLYFAAILSCRLEYLNKAFVLLRAVIIEALELRNFLFLALKIS